MNIMGKRIPYILGALPYNFFDLQGVRDHSSRSHYLEANKDETGWDRLYNMFSLDEYGNKSPEMNFIVLGTSVSTIAGVMWGGTSHARIAYMNFIETNHATKFESMFEAKKKLQDAVTVNFAKGAFKVGWRLGLFTGSYILISTTIATYRGKSSLLEYTTAGFVTGSCYKMGLGPKGMIVGGGLGAVLGGIAGLLSLGLLRLSGTTMEEIRYWQYGWKKARDKQIQGSFNKLGDGDTNMEKAHDKLVADLKEAIPDTEVKSK